MKPANFAPVYMAGVYPRWAEIARSHGYALAVHGSCARDLDVVFVPWGDTLSTPEAVLTAITEEFAVTAVGGLEVKPHGRLCQTLAWMGDCFADVSFIVPAPTPPQPSEETREGVYGEWRWADHRRCWQHDMPLRIYPHDDGKFTVSTNETWHDGIFESFEAAELEAFGGRASPQPSEAEVERVARAIYSARIAGGKSYCGFDDLCTNGYNDTYEAVVADARAALSAMSRPDPEKLAEIRERHDHLDGQLSKRTTEITAYEGYSAHADLGTVLAMLEGTR